LAGTDQQPVSALSGKTLAVKDLFHMAGLPTGAGSPDWLRTHDLAEITSPVISSLLAAGCEFAGKTLTDELAYSLNGQNQHYGTPVNPAAPERLPGGSSSGSAVAVANHSADIGLGTDTGGSIRVPASYNGLYGLRPTHNLVSTDALIDLAPRFDTVGWLTRDFATQLAIADLFLPKTSVELGSIVIADLPWLPHWSAKVGGLAQRLAALGFAVNTLAIPEDTLAQASAAFRTLQARQIWRSHGQWIIEENPSFAPDIQERFLWCATLCAQEESQAQDAADNFIAYWQDAVMPMGSCLLMPSAPGAAPLLSSTAQYLADYRNQLMGLTAPTGLTGGVQLSIPAMADQGAPWGLSLCAGAGNDWALLRLAEALLPHLLEAN
jgi:aspartyl-tRNA(Asn)/glutamyl-tRNA(Gln) amidotransferase subunit A